LRSTNGRTVGGIPFDGVLVAIVLNRPPPPLRGVLPSRVAIPGSNSNIQKIVNVHAAPMKAHELFWPGVW